MEISNKISPVDRTAYTRQGVNKVEQTPTPAAKGDRVELSSRAKALQAAHEVIRKMDDMDHEKVARIKAQIESGTYKVDADKIAARMLEDSLLGGKD